MRFSSLFSLCLLVLACLFASCSGPAPLYPSALRELARGELALPRGDLACNGLAFSDDGSQLLLCTDKGSRVYEAGGHFRELGSYPHAKRSPHENWVPQGASGKDVDWDNPFLAFAYMLYAGQQAPAGFGQLRAYLARQAQPHRYLPPLKKNAYGMRHIVEGVAVNAQGQPTTLVYLENDPFMPCQTNVSYMGSTLSLDGRVIAYERNKECSRDYDVVFYKGMKLWREFSVAQLRMEYEDQCSPGGIWMSPSGKWAAIQLYNNTFAHPSSVGDVFYLMWRSLTTTEFSSSHSLVILDLEKRRVLFQKYLGDSHSAPDIQCAFDEKRGRVALLNPDSGEITLYALKGEGEPLETTSVSSQP